MLEGGIIEPSDSEWSSPPVLVLKRDRTYRLAIDFRALNRLTKTDSYPLPTIESILRFLYGSVVFSCLDLKSGFWQTLIAPEDRKKTAFAVEGIGLFQFRRLAFGLKNSSACFQRLMDRVFIRQIGRNVVVYIDDILVHSSSLDNHVDDLRETLGALREAGLTVNPN